MNKRLMRDIAEAKTTFRELKFHSPKTVDFDSSAREWKNILEENMDAIESLNEETLWPRDTTFRYLQLMESLQENMEEYKQLQEISCSLILKMNDD